MSSQVYERKENGSALISVHPKGTINTEDESQKSTRNGSSEMESVLVNGADNINNHDVVSNK